MENRDLILAGDGEITWIFLNLLCKTTVCAEAAKVNQQ